jgi:shikimate dehydrogenase
MKKYLVIGNPIDHSLSPKLHNYWIKKNKIDAIYEKKLLVKGDLEKIISKLKLGEIDGINVTVPFKNTVISYIDELSEEAKKTQSVNTIYCENNKTIGHNTDIAGFELGLRHFKYNVSGKKVLILGAGGVVPSIIFALKKMKASNIVLSNRTKSKAENIKKIFPEIGIIDWGKTGKFDMIINATSIGLKSDDEIKINYNDFGKNKFFYDVIYNPKETNFLQIGKQTGNKSENGKLMFIYQAAFAFKLWHGINPEVSKEIIELLD